MILAISPHLDDAAFSAGGALATWGRGGAVTVAGAQTAVTVATVFTQSHPAPAGFALRCQTDKGIAPDVDYLALRREEDRAACAALGADPVWLDLPEAPHRGYDSPEALFAGVHDGDRRTWRDALDRLRALVAARPPRLVLSCQGLGGHVDHLHVVRAVAALADETGLPVAWWRDAPYALRAPAAPPALGLPAGLSEVAVPVGGAALAAKLDACAAYASQIPYQFGRDAAAPPEAAMRERLAAFADAEGARLGAGRSAEAFAVADPAALADVR
ncbi:PIG-L deacetylase family protein [Rubrivirga litoralis]|uniref:PIG-L family deacetylase n=1 Tax=Rubrivirga litoralis TaxID=3075598 RepID=A0ABU3BQD5_9BACT|nr:PIG-L family deacetylase [Rubrivirga sp. F394]MDT0631501.1 PIG-L family deacetylase [Rubrivirga sp. F394]